MSRDQLATLEANARLKEPSEFDLFEQQMSVYKAEAHPKSRDKAEVPEEVPAKPRNNAKALEEAKRRGPPHQAEIFHIYY